MSRLPGSKAGVWLGLACLLAAWWPAAAHAQQDPPAPRALRRAGLSAEQIRRIGEVSYRAERQKLEIQHRLEVARLELERLLGAERPDRRAVFAKLEQVGRLETELRKNRLGLLLDIRALVTAEQWQRLEMLHYKRRQRRQQRGR